MGNAFDTKSDLGALERELEKLRFLCIMNSMIFILITELIKTTYHSGVVFINSI